MNSIRPLQTSDLRFRKLSGRHQISSDGKHLVDGVAFGRPFLHRGSRPPIRIPPRKRIRLIENEDDDGLTIQNIDREVIVRPDTNDHEDQTVDSDDADDEDFEYQGEDEEPEDLAAEAGALLQDLQGIGRDFMHIDASTREANGSDKEERRSKRLLATKHVPRGLGLQGSDLPQFWNDIATAYPGVYTNPVLEQYGEDNDSSDRKAMRPEKHERGKEKLKARKKSMHATPSFQVKSLGRKRRGSSASGKSVRFEEAGLQTPATVLEAGENEGSGGEFEPIDTESDKENTEPVDVSKNSDEVCSANALDYTTPEIAIVVVTDARSLHLSVQIQARQYCRKVMPRAPVSLPRKVLLPQARLHPTAPALATAPVTLIPKQKAWTRSRNKLPGCPVQQQLPRTPVLPLPKLFKVQRKVQISGPEVFYQAKVKRVPSFAMIGGGSRKNWRT